MYRNNICMTGTNEDITEKANKSKESFEINVDIREFVLTPLSCAYILNDFIKCLIYQKLQIPYPYNWLEAKINKKRSNLQQETTGQRNFTVSRHYQQASAAYDCLEALMKAFVEEFKKSTCSVKEIVLGFGTLPQCLTLACRIYISKLASGHSERNHVDSNIKQQHKILRKIFTSPIWMDFLDMTLNSLNMFVFLRKAPLTAAEEQEDSFFIPSKDLSFTPSTKQMHIYLEYSDILFTNSDCCRIEIFDENISTPSSNSEINDIFSNCDRSDSTETCWFQGKVPVKGFKECFINKVSASELW